MEARSREETLRMEARTKQLVEAEREHLLSQLSQLIPNFDPSMLKPKTSPCQNQGLEQSPKNPMSDKASCSGMCLYDHLKVANMFNMVGFIDPAQVSANAGRHWVLLIVRAKKGTVYVLDPLPGNCVVNEEAKTWHTKATQQCRMQFAKGKGQAPYPQAAIDEVRNEWAEFVCLHVD
ncbi:unnamed protein product [Prunus armeniaca]